MAEPIVPEPPTPEATSSRRETQSNCTFEDQAIVKRHEGE